MSQGNKDSNLLNLPEKKTKDLKVDKVPDSLDIVKELKNDKPKSRALTPKTIEPEMGFHKKVYKIALTGGPCAGKSTASTILKEKLSANYTLYFLPEMASTVITSGVSLIPTGFTNEQHKEATKAMMQMQMDVEDYFVKMAQLQERDVIIICDRGAIDNFAYCSREVESQILKETKWSLSKIRDQRYDAVIHLVTAADGAEAFYTLKNNQARTESPELARELDQKTQAAWNGHPNLTVITNEACADNKTSSFRIKMEAVYKSICRVLDLPEQPTITKKYLVKGIFSVQMLPNMKKYEEYYETYDFLPSVPGEHFWIKKRIVKGQVDILYTTTCRKLAENEFDKLEVMRTIPEMQYCQLLQLVDHSKQPVHKTSVVFVESNQTCVVETMKLKSGEKVSVLRISVNDTTSVKIPPYIPVDKEITGDKAYSTYFIANKLMKVQDPVFFD